MLAAALGLGCALTLALSGWLSHPPPPVYNVTDLGILPGDTNSVANAINSRGEIAGSARLSGRGSFLYERATLYQGGRLTNLGVLGGASGSSARDINAQGEVTGTLWLPNAHHAFLYRQGKMRDLGSPPGSADNFGVGINDRGEAVGTLEKEYGQPGQQQEHVFLYRKGRMTDLGTPPGCRDSHAGSINNAGQIAGNCRLRLGGTRPFLLDSRTRRWTPLPVPLPYRRGWAVQANGAGQTVGDVVMPDGACHAVLWRGIQMTDMGTPSGDHDSIGASLNNRGEAVGHSFREDGPAPTFLKRFVRGGNPLRRYLDRPYEHAFVYRDGKMQDLNELIPTEADWTLEEAHGINDRGQIVGQGLHHGQERAFLLTPIK